MWEDILVKILVAITAVELLQGAREILGDSTASHFYTLWIEFMCKFATHWGNRKEEPVAAKVITA